MQAKAYRLSHCELETYIAGADWPCWVVEFPHRLVFSRPTDCLREGECLRVHCLAGRAFGPGGEFRWWHDRDTGCLRATLIWDEGEVAGPVSQTQPEDWKRDGDTEALDQTCLVWGDRAGSGEWDDRGRMMPPGLDNLFSALSSNAKYRGIVVRHYKDAQTGEVLLSRFVAPVDVEPQHPAGVGATGAQAKAGDADA